MIRATHTHTSVYATAPCGHRVGVPNEAYEEVVEVVCETPEGDEIVLGHPARWAVHVVHLEGVPTCRFAPAAAEPVAEAFHRVYELLAPEFGYATRDASAVEWAAVAPRLRLLMMATVAEVAGADPLQLAVVAQVGSHPHG